MTKTVEQKRTGYDDDDLRQIAERKQAALAKRDDTIRAARDTYKREIKVIEAEAKAVNVQPGPLKVAEAIVAAQAKVQAEVDRVKADEVELVRDMVSVLAPFDDTPLGAAAAAFAAREAADAEREAQEQALGERVLAELAGQAVN